MSSSTGSVPPDASASVFVDESGRRRTRALLVARALVGGAVFYVLVLIAGLTGSVSLPGLHLGEIPRVAPTRESAGRLGTASKEVALPSALDPRGSGRGGSTPSGQSPGGVAPGVRGGQPNGTAPTVSASTPTATSGPSTTRPAPTTTTIPVTTTTKAHGPSTTNGHGPPTSTSHGPPTSTPGQGTPRSKL